MNLCALWSIHGYLKFVSYVWVEERKLLCQNPCLDRSLRESVGFRVLMIKGRLIPRAQTMGLMAL